MTPHRPHGHAHEELLDALDGEAELIVADESGCETAHRVRPGFFAYYPENQLHTLRGVREFPVTYLVFRWKGARRAAQERLGLLVCGPDEQGDATAGHAFRAQRIFEGGARYLGKLHAHASTVAPGGGYAAHIDDHDVAIAMREGTIATGNQLLGRHGVAFFPGGRLHGMQKPGDTTARYLVFEFHNQPQP